MTEAPKKSGFPVWHCGECRQPNDMLRGVCRGCGVSRPCEHYDKATEKHCGRQPTSLYLQGTRCSGHAPDGRRDPDGVVDLAEVRRKRLETAHGR